MKKDVVISIKGISYSDEFDDEDIVELTTIGDMRYKEGKYFLTYKETEMTGMLGTVTVLEIDGQNQVILNRRGTNKSQLIIEKGKRHICQYGTEYGEMVLGVTTDSIKSTLSSKGGALSFKYSLDVNSSLASMNEVYIDVKECLE